MEAPFLKTCLMAVGAVITIGAGLAVAVMVWLLVHWAMGLLM